MLVFSLLTDYDIKDKTMCAYDEFRHEMEEQDLHRFEDDGGPVQASKEEDLNGEPIDLI
jgi:hypothetical protein